MGTTINLAEDQAVSFSGANDISRFASSYQINASNHFTSTTGNLKVYGNLRLMNGNRDSTDTYGFGFMFADNTHIVDASKLILNKWTGGSCFYYMFRDCSALTAAPILPSTALSGNSNCVGMFQNCTSLSTVPENMLPAPELTQWCYFGMFQGCSALTAAPILPATTLPNQCYENMFNGCTNLKYINVNFTTWNNTYNWVNGVGAGGTFVKPTDLPESYSSEKIPKGWTVVNK